MPTPTEAEINAATDRAHSILLQLRTRVLEAMLPLYGVDGRREVLCTLSATVWLTEEIAAFAREHYGLSREALDKLKTSAATAHRATLHEAAETGAFRPRLG